MITKIRRRERIKSIREVSKRLKKVRPNLSIYEFWKKHKNYNNYLKSEDWKILKELYYSYRSTRFCVQCHSIENLQLHHKSYKNLGRNTEVLSIVTLCAKCHMKEHGIV